MEVFTAKRSARITKKLNKIVENLFNKSYNIIETKEKRSKRKMEVKQGEIVDGTVTGIQPYGAFIKMDNGEDGLVYIEDLSVARIKSPEERVKVGQKIKCMVKYVDENTGRISLSYKNCLGTWDDNIKKFKEGMTVKGIVRDTEKNKNGIFIELTPNLVGMAEYTEEIKYGETVDVCIKKILPEKKKVKLIIV